MFFLFVPTPVQTQGTKFIIQIKWILMPCIRARRGVADRH